MCSSKRIPAYYWFPVLASVCLGFVFISIPPVAESFMQVFGVSHAGLSVFLSALFLGHSLIQVPAGVIVDRLGVQYSLYLGLLFQLIPTFLPFFWPESLLFGCIMRFIVGVGSGILFLAVVKSIILLAPAGYAERAQGFQGAAFSFGCMLPYLALPVWGEWGWAASYGIGTILCLVLLYSIFRLPQEKLKREEGPKVAFKLIVKACVATLTLRNIIILGCVHGFSFGTINAVASWLPLLLKELALGEQATLWAMSTGAVFFIAGFARILSGELGARHRKIDVILVCLFFSVLLLFAASFFTNPHLVLMLGMGIGLVCGLSYSSVFILTSRFVIPGYMATGIGAMNTLANLINLIMVFILGLIRERFESFSYGLLFMGCAALIVWLVALKNRKALSK